MLIWLPLYMGLVATLLLGRPIEWIFAIPEKKQWMLYYGLFAFFAILYGAVAIWLVRDMKKEELDERKKWRRSPDYIKTGPWD